MSQARPPAKLLPRVLWRVLPPTIVVLFGVWFAALGIVRQSVSTELNQRLDRLAIQAATAISLKLQALVGIAESLAGNNLVINSLFDFQERENYIPIFFRSLSVPGLTGARVTLIDYRGRKVASNTKDVDYRDAPFVPIVMQGERFIRISDEGVLIALAARHAGRPEGILVIELDDEHLADLFAIPLQSGDLAIKLTEGGIVFATGTAFGTKDKWSVTPEREDWVAAEVEVPRFPQISLRFAEPTRNALGLVDRLFRYLLIVLVFSVGAVGLAVVTTAYLGTRPLNRFMEDIERIRRSQNLSYRMTPFGAAEFHRLASSFNLLLETLESTTTSRDYVDSVLNSIHEILLVTNEKGFVVTCNQATIDILGYSAEELESIHVLTLFSSETEALSGADVTHLSSVEGTATTNVGRIFPIRISASSFGPRSLDGQSMIYVLVDITERKQFEQTIQRKVTELARSNQELEQFASIASHDLQEPLRKVQAFGDRLHNNYAEVLDERGLDYLERMKKATARMQTLINDLLVFSRVGTKDEPFVEVDLGEVLQTVLSDLELRIQETGAKVDIGTLPSIAADPMQMHQLLQNLIGNALKYHREGVAPIVRVEVEIDERASAQGQWIADPLCCIRISDNGIGFEDDYAERIFGIFQRLHGQGTYEGTGIGLAICQKIIERHGGSIEAKGRPGEGATFMIYLPVKSAQPGTHAA